MQKLINQNAVLENQWTLVTDEDTLASGNLPAGKIMVPGAYFLANKADLLARGDIAVVLAGDADLAEYADDLAKLPVIAVSFPAFTGGRGYSLARLLKERYNYQGEIRAVGDVLIDQLHFMKRCGFDTYLLKDGLDGEKALNYFATFSDPYQLAYDVKEPLFRRKA